MSSNPINITETSVMQLATAGLDVFTFQAMSVVVAVSSIMGYFYIVVRFSIGRNPQRKKLEPAVAKVALASKTYSLCSMVVLVALTYLFVVLTRSGNDRELFYGVLGVFGVAAVIIHLVGFFMIAELIVIFVCSGCEETPDMRFLSASVIASYRRVSGHSWNALCWNLGFQFVFNVVAICMIPVHVLVCLSLLIVSNLPLLLAYTLPFAAHLDDDKLYLEKESELPI
jgi:hypothetical protein